MLVDRLELLEPGLELVATEYRLTNPLGSGGRPDILARDRYGNYVLIEVKENDPAARTALNEVAKYAGLLCGGDSRVPPEKVRIMIVSTTWRELLVPVSEFARNCVYDVRGYQITFAEDGMLLPATRVRLLTAGEAQRPTPLGIVYFYPEAEDRERDWAEVIRVVTQAGARDMIGVDFDYVGTDRHLPGPYALYVAFGTTTSEIDETAIRPADEQPEDLWEAEYPREYRVLCRMTSTVFPVRPGSCESGGPETFLKLDGDPRWELRQVRGTGAYAPGGLWRERDICIALAGGDGEPGRVFIGRASTKIRSRWAMLQAATNRTLADNEEWRMLLGDVLDLFAAADIEMDVLLWINNPGSLIETLVFGVPDKIADYEPVIHCIATRPDGWRIVVNGRLSWNGKPTEDPLRLLRTSCTFPVSWMISSNDWWLLDKLGLHYTLQSFVVSPGPDSEPQPSTILVPVEDEVHQVHEQEDFATAGWHDFLTLGDFVARYRHEIQQFVNEQLTYVDMP